MTPFMTCQAGGRPATPRRLSPLAMSCLALLCLAAFLQPLAAAESPGRDDLLALFRDRNIFDPNRRAPRRGEERREFTPPPRAETFRLLGALTHDDKAFGFFDGTDSDYRRVVALGETIADFKVAAIDTSAVTLKRDEETIVMNIGTGMRRQSGGDWTPAEAQEENDYRAPAERATEAGERADSPPAEAGAKEGDNDILKRMMERRRQEQSR